MIQIYKDRVYFNHIEELPMDISLYNYSEKAGAGRDNLKYILIVLLTIVIMISLY